ncbi:3-keto-5-aminohexanoate cleavage protein [Kineococcus sp. SYSU DK005]|uniref:3-keto-5-aminohexanoate cleavage protein n=1 Tax=Kineococcus sp. SYSU DK005 TaxID=3383126 RepID=UPI003D7CAD07
MNGARRPGEHPALPVTPGELAREVAAVAAAGAEAVHLHVKDAAGVDTLEAAALAEVLVAVRQVAPAVPVGVSTGAWAVPDAVRRLAAIRSWEGSALLPDFASVNWHEDGADEVAGALLELGVGVEAGIWHRAGAGAWLASVHRHRCVRVLLELPNGLGEAEVQHRAEQLLHLVGRSQRDGRSGGDEAEEPQVLLHGKGATAWSALRLAGRCGLATRIGLEDVLVLPDGAPAADNAALVRAAQQVLRAPASTPR